MYSSLRDRSYLFRVLELFHERVVVFLGDAFRVAGGRLDVGLQTSFEQLVDRVVVVVVVADSKQRVDVVVDSLAER